MRSSIRMCIAGDVRWEPVGQAEIIATKIHNRVTTKIAMEVI